MNLNESMLTQSAYVVPVCLGDMRFICCYDLPTNFVEHLTLAKKNVLIFSISLLCVAALTGCALFPSWHWEKKGASEAEYSFDEAQCKAKVYSGTDGMVTNASVRRMHGCMEAKGWVKVPN
jgi:hypothetical protein